MTTLPLWRTERIVVPCIASLIATPPECGMHGQVAKGIARPKSQAEAECGMEKQGMSFLLHTCHLSLVTHHLLSTGVRFVVHLHQVVEVDVRVFLGGRETRVP